MHITYRCPSCDQSHRTHDVDVESVIDCPACDWTKAIEETDVSNGRPQHCLICGNPDLWRQKDFPQVVGMTLVAIAALLSTIAWYYQRPIWAIGILMAFAAFDLLIFAIMPDVLVCYRCKSRHHAAHPDADHPTFDHEMAERYRQEEIRMKELGT